MWRSTLEASELGLWRATDGTLTALANVGPGQCREFTGVTLDAAGALPARQCDRRQRRADRGRALPRIVATRWTDTFHGDNWIGLRIREASVVRGIGVLPVFAGLIGLLLLVGALAATWTREGR